MDTHDIILTVACGAAAQSSWWTMSTAAAYLYFLMPNVTPSFWVALVFGCGGGLSALLTFILPPRVQHTAESTQAIASFVLQAAATGAILAVCVLHTHVFGSTSRTVAEQQALLSVVAALFFVASMASFRAQEILNGVLNGYGKDYVPWFWRGGTVCALLMGCLQLILRTLVPKSEAGITFLGVGTFISLCGVPAFAAIRRPVAERQPLLADQVQVPDKGKSLTAWEVFVVGRVPLICAGVDFGYMMMLYPGVLSVLHGEAQADSLFSVILFCCFNCGDFVGKTLPHFFKGLQRPDRQGRLIAALATEIAVFVPLIISCVVFRKLHMEILAYVLAACFAMVHGFISVSAYTMATAVVQQSAVAGGALDTSVYRDAAATATAKAGQLNFACSFAGVFFGSMASIGLSYSSLVHEHEQ